MLAELDDAISDVIVVEGRQYTNDRDDSGGATKFGITKATLSAFRGYQVTDSDVERMDESEARLIYKQEYWFKPGFNAIAELSEKIALELLDTGINCGTGRASKLLQRSLNVLNNKGTAYDDLMVDGDIGPATLAALRAYLRHRGGVGEQVLFVLLNCLQGAYYVSLCEAREKDEKFMYGWLVNRVADQVIP